MEVKRVFEICEKRMGKLETNRKVNDDVFRRAIYYKVCLEVTSATLRQIAELVGKNHDAVLHNTKNFDFNIKGRYRSIYEDLLLECSTQDLEGIENEINKTKEKLWNLQLKKWNLQEKTDDPTECLVHDPQVVENGMRLTA